MAEPGCLIDFHGQTELFEVGTDVWPDRDLKLLDHKVVTELKRLLNVAN